MMTKPPSTRPPLRAKPTSTRPIFGRPSHPRTKPPIPGSQALPTTSPPIPAEQGPVPVKPVPGTYYVPPVENSANVIGSEGAAGMPGVTPDPFNPGQPLKAVPSYRRGGTVRKTGLAYVHKGERITPANRASQYPAMSKALSRLRPQPRRRDK